MTEETKKAPVMRFQGFSDDWEQRKLSEMTEYKNGKGHEDKQRTHGKYELINLNSISIDGGLKHSGKYIDDANETLKKYDLVMVLSDIGHGDLLGRVALIPEDNRFVLNQRVALLRPKSLFNPLFLFSYINQHQKYFKNQGAGMSQLNISRGSVESFSSYVPSAEEQTKIGTFFKQLDDTIALHQRKLTLFNQLKETYLKQMFPQNEENMPVLRFADFSEPWEQRKLGDTVQITMGQSPNGENYTDNPRDHILVQGNADMKNGRVCPRVWTTQVTKKADPEDIILSVRAPVGDVGRTDYTVVLGRGVAGIKGNAFIFQTLSRMKEQGFWTRYSSGSTFESINSADLKDAFIQICHIEEQTKIGDFFTKLDDTIALHQSKLQKLAELKKTLLAKMLV